MSDLYFWLLIVLGSAALFIGACNFVIHVYFARKEEFVEKLVNKQKGPRDGEV